MQESMVNAQGRQNGDGGRNLTTHSTGARVSRSVIVESSLAGLSSRPVNSGVRWLTELDACRDAYG